MTWYECPWHRHDKARPFWYLCEGQFNCKSLGHSCLSHIIRAHWVWPSSEPSRRHGPVPSCCCSLIWLSFLISSNPARIIFICTTKPGGSFLILCEERHLLNDVVNHLGWFELLFWLDGGSIRTEACCHWSARKLGFSCETKMVLESQEFLAKGRADIYYLLQRQRN